MSEHARPTTLYRFFAADGRLLYVGISGLATVRWYTHSVQKQWWAEVASITVVHYADRAEAHEAELRAILNEGPKYNIAGRFPITLPRVGGMRKHGTGPVFFNRAERRWVALLPNAMGRAAKYFGTREEAETYLDARLEAAA